MRGRRGWLYRDKYSGLNVVFCRIICHENRCMPRYYCIDLRIVIPAVVGSSPIVHPI